MADAAVLVARVLPDLTGLDRQFDYLVPDAWRDRVAIGTRVRVPLNGRTVGGWVVALTERAHAAATAPVPVSGDAHAPSLFDLDHDPPAADPGQLADTVDTDRLLPLAKVTGHGPDATILDLAAWAGRRWAGRLRPFMVTASPPHAVVGLPPPQYGAPVPEPVDPAARGVLDAGGGVLRMAPSADVVPVVLAACRRGPTLVVVPAVATARVLASRLRRAGRRVALMPNDWALAAGGVDVVIGARAAVWAPCRDLAAVVVLDEQDEALQEQRQPTWHARDVAVERARRAGVPAVLASPCPSLAALADLGPAGLVRPSVDSERSGWPIVEIVDRSQDAPWQKSMVTSPLIRQLRDPDRTVVVVLNSTGRSRLLACRHCKALQRCERCDASVTQRDDGTFACLRCDTVRPAVCQVCGAAGFANLRAGVTRLREELEAAAGRAVVAVTGTESDPVPPAGVYVGTEAVLHRVSRADTVAFVDIDAELLAPRYRASEQAMTLLARAARLVGGRATGARLLVQTFVPAHPVLDAVRHADPGRLVADEMRRRRLLGFPPAAAIALVTGEGAREYGDSLRAAGVEVASTLDGATLLRASDWDALGAALADHPRPTGSRLRIQVDPPRL